LHFALNLEEEELHTNTSCLFLLKLQDTLMQENQAREAAEKFVALYYDRLDKHRHVS